MGTTLGYILAGLTALLWGLVVFLVRGVKTPGHIGIGISLPAGIATLLVIAPFAGPWNLEPGRLLSWAGLFLLAGGLLQFPLATLCYYESVRLAEVSTAVPLTRLKAVMVALIAFLFGIEPISARIGIASVLDVGGAILLTYQKAAASPHAPHARTGAAFAIGASLCWALGDISMRLALETVPAMPATLVALVFGALVYYAAMLAAGQLPKVLSIPRPEKLRFAAHGVLSFGIGYYMFFAAIRILGVTKVAIITCGWPLIAFLAGVAVYGESMTFRKLAGVALIMLAVVLVVVS